MAEKMAVGKDGDFQSRDQSPVASNDPKIKRGKVDSLTLYEITDYELDLLEKGSPSSTVFNFAIFFLSIGTSFLITILSTEIAHQRTHMYFSLAAFVGLALGTVLLTLWFRTRSELTAVCKKIRGRIAD
ncbi:hypothetical protein [Agrobacterium radiobacter]|uniref:hypothetical protein n=1 Tax=Agrobacterium radiobacter TaxID=362 RepID=UPI003CE56C49